MNPMYKAMLGGLLRHLVTAAGTYGVVISDSQLQTIISGAVTLAPILQSAYQKFRVNRKIQKAAASGMP